MTYSNTYILESIAGKDNSQILSYLYKTYFPRIKKLIVENSGNPEDAEDIFQEAIVILYRQVKLNRFDSSYEVGAFIYSVARNLWINEAKRRKVKEKVYKEESTAINYSETDTLDLMITEERSQLLTSVLEQLGDRCKELLSYTIYHKMSMKEICEKMGFSTENGAKTRNYKCKQQLISLLKKNPLVQELMNHEQPESQF